ncbi:hypothetical protein HOG48_03410 [Candidatus Peregrinibacteria bacterium]|jgi:hypothetical protein|nr:hypothetical protein [Candidatus Peregrinibacteria bacterium]
MAPDGSGLSPFVSYKPDSKGVTKALEMILDGCAEDVRAHLEEQRPLLEAVAEALIEHKTINNAQFMVLIEDHHVEKEADEDTIDDEVGTDPEIET